MDNTSSIKRSKKEDMLACLRTKTFSKEGVSDFDVLKERNRLQEDKESQTADECPLSGLRLAVLTNDRDMDGQCC